MGRPIVLFDVASAGASGDMFLSALIDLIGDDEAILRVAASMLIYDPTLRVNVTPVTVGDTEGKRLDITLDTGVRFEPQAMHEVLKEVATELELSEHGLETAERMLDILFTAESKAHDTPVDELHLHEVGSIDTVLDVVGVVYLLEKAGLLGAKFISTHVAIGQGSIETEHGAFEVPVPAVAEILVAHDIPFHRSTAQTETLTPTGAAILAALAEDYVDSTEGIELERSGVGFGTRDLGETPNAMHIHICRGTAPAREAAEMTREAEAEGAKEAAAPVEAPEADRRLETLTGWDTDEVVVLETNVDDVDGETMGTLFDALLDTHGVFDVVAIPAYGKKNRPCLVVKVIASARALAEVPDILVKHLGTIGVRYTTWRRVKATRETVVCRIDVEGKEYMVRVKVSRSADGSVVNVKPEADDVRKVARETGIPTRFLRPMIILQAKAVTE